MEVRSTWSGRERSSHSRFPPVPRVGLVTFLLLFSIVCPSLYFFLVGIPRIVFFIAPVELRTLRRLFD
jgi:hypothetical protein